MSQKVETEKWLVRVGLCALTLLPVAHLTSLGVMEIAGFVLLVVCAGLFVNEAINDGLIALNRLRSASALPILGYTAVTLISITLMLEHAADQLSALRELKWVLYFFAFAYFFERYFNTAWGRYLPVFAAVISVVGAFSIGQFLFGIEYPRPESVLERWGDYFRVTGFFNVPQSFAGNLGMAVFFFAWHDTGSAQRSRICIKRVALAISSDTGPRCKRFGLKFDPRGLGRKCCCWSISAGPGQKDVGAFITPLPDGPLSLRKWFADCIRRPIFGGD